jgi:hypothetical protein
VEAAAAAFAARASKVLLLRLPFGRPRFRDVEGAVSSASTSSLLPSGTLSLLAVEPLGDDMIGLGPERAKLEVRGEVGDALGSEHARYLKKSGEEVTPRRFGNHSRIVCHRGGCHSGSWEELLGHVADTCQITSHDDSGSYDGGDSEVKMTRLAADALRRPPRGNKTRSGASSQETARRLAAASRVTSWNRLVSRRLGELHKTQPR